MQRENYYILLGLDPDVHTTWALIEPIFQKKSNEWARGKDSHRDRERFAQYMRLRPEIKKVLQDDTLRQQEADESRTLRQQHTADRLIELAEHVRLAAMKEGGNYLTKNEIKGLVALGNQRWTEAEILQVAQQQNLPIHEHDPEQLNDEKRLDDSAAKEIVQRLQSLNQMHDRRLRTETLNDLYDFLDVERTTTTATLHQKAKQLYQEYLGWSAGAEASLLLDLAGKCVTYFQSDAQRDLYDASLRWLALEGIRNDAEAAGASSGKIGPKVVEELVARGAKQNLAQERVVQAIREVGRRRRWSVEIALPASSPGTNVVRTCQACRSLFDAKEAKCPQCGKDARRRCPQCNHDNPTDARYCYNTACSFAVGDMGLAERLLSAAKILQNTDRLGAIQRLQEALTYWPKHPETTRLLQDLQNTEQQFRQRLEQLETAARHRRFQEAQDLWHQLQQPDVVQPRLQTLEAPIKAALQNAAQQVRRAKQAEQNGKLDDAFELYQAALRECEDYEEANEGLRFCYPAPPQAATLNSTPAGIILQWEPSPSRGIVTYHIVRKEGGPPTQPTDGLVLLQGGTAPFYDRSAVPGQHYHYAIYALREETLATKPVLLGPAIRIAEVTQVSFIARDRTVELSWQPAPNTRGIEIWRQADREPARGEGTQVTQITGKGATDAGLDNGTKYGYRIVSLFTGGRGETIASPGVTFITTPERLPEPVMQLHFKRLIDNQLLDNQFEVEWAAPPRGVVRVYALAPAFATAYRPGQPLDAMALERLGVQLRTNGPRSALGPVDPSMTQHYLPVTIVGQTAVAGKIVSVEWIDDVSKLNVWLSNGKLEASWNFAREFNNVVVAIRTDVPPTGPTDPEAKCIPWSRLQSEEENGFLADAPTGEEAFVTVYSATQRQGTWRYSPGQTATVALGRHRRVHYVVRPLLRFGIWRTGLGVLRIMAEQPTTLPALKLVARRGGYPLRPTDDDKLLLLPPTTIEGRRPWRAVFMLPEWCGPLNARLFPANDSDLGWLELVQLD